MTSPISTKSHCPHWLLSPQRGTVAHPVQLHTKVPDQVGVLDALKDLEFVGCLLDGFMVIGLKSDL